jgi:D-amino-acid dehydrogenase
MHVCVLGAGIVGLASAYELHRRGYRVTVLDQSGPGAGASGGNGGQLSYDYVQPLADPGVWRQLPKLLLAPDSPLAFRPQWDVQQWRWGAAFLRACNTSQSRRTTQALLSLAVRSRAGLSQFIELHAPSFDHTLAGKLVVYADSVAFDDARRQMDLQAHWGSVQEAASRQRCVDLEPALSDYAPQIAGAIYTPGECAADCLALCKALAQHLITAGVKFLSGTAISGFAIRGRRIAAVRTTAGDVTADSFVMALGSNSYQLARGLGVRLPLYPLKGYSITLDVGSDAAAPRVSVTDAARKVVFARMGTRLRVAGMAELTGHDLHIDPRRIASLLRSVKSVFPNCSFEGELNPWAGLRPATPTGLPIVGMLSAAPSNLFFNTGHGALGFTLAFGTADLLADAFEPERRSCRQTTFLVRPAN